MTIALPVINLVEPQNVRQSRFSLGTESNSGLPEYKTELMKDLALTFGA
jgi:hypothetical protein